MDKVIPEYADKFSVEHIYSIDYSELNGILIKEYGFNDFECALEQSNGSNIRIEVDGVFSMYEENELTKFLETGRQEYSTTRLLMNNLCRRGKIYPGTYLIDVSW